MGVVSKKIPVMEVFGPTIQGEGMVIGRKTMFVRTGGCDYKCAWCDSAFTWDGSQKAEMLGPEELFQRVLMAAKSYSSKGETVAINFDHITISGGNPALIGGAMAEFIETCHRWGVRVGLETQGSQWQDWFYLIDDLTISPKAPSSGMRTNYTKLDAVITNLMLAKSNFSLKVVVFNDEDFEYAKFVHHRYAKVPFFVQVGNEDPRTDGDIRLQLLEKLEWLSNKVIADPEMNSVRVLPQMHTLMWNNKRGV